MNLLIVALMIGLLVLAAGCNTELGHHHEEDHDHDGDGIPDHAPEDHRHTENRENQHVEKAG